MTQDLVALIKKEGWELRKKDKDYCIVAYGQEYPFTHPVLIHLKRYREEKIPELKFQHMKAVHDYLWPGDVKSWHYWTEIRFREHCQGWNSMSWAGCASSAKSYDAAKVALIFWLANPQHRAIMVASTTLVSMGKRVWGYITKLLNKMAVPLPYRYTAGNSPQILYPYDRGEGEAKDTLHGIFAAAAKQGSDETAISNFIGVHPDEAMMLILDEATELPISILNSLANLKSTEKPFQIIAIGNSSSMFDLHGALSTPKDGWNSIDPYTASKWETTQKNGVCLYFNAYNSPAIHETNADKKKILSGFLATKKSVQEAEDTYGKDSIMFWRFTLGFWQSTKIEKVVMTKEFMQPFDLYTKAHWLGVDPLIVVGGLDPAFSTGGDSCILRLGYLGQTVDGSIVLDFRGNSLLFKIHISAVGEVDIGIQIATQVEKILNDYGCPLSNLCVDATGQGRAISSTLMLKMKSMRPPIKILTTRTGGEKDKSFDVVPKTKHDLWFDFRRFVENRSIKGIDEVSAAQFTNRLIIQNPKTLKQEIESKIEYKKRMGAIMPTLAHSPDEADSATLCLQSAIINFGFTPGQRKEIPQVNPAFIQEIANWKNNVRMVQEEHMKGPGRPVGYPTAGFTSDKMKPWGTL